MMLRVEAMLTPTIRESINLQLHVACYTCMYFTTVWNRENELLLFQLNSSIPAEQ